MNVDMATIRAHWDQQATKGVTAGTQDLVLKSLERRAIRAEMASEAPLKILEIGCGLGETARQLCGLHPSFSLLAVDRSSAMLAEAARWPYQPNLSFAVGDALDPPLGPFDVVYTQRCLINLPTWEMQRQAIDAIADRLVSGGRYLMCEHSQEGLDALNGERVAFGLEAIVPPFHNRYVRDAELATVTSLRLVRCDPFSARYYYHSRVINAWLAKEAGQAPDYFAPVNQMVRATDRPFPLNVAQGKLWVWEKP